jgi:uncharacterized membrane protein YfcA
MLLLALGAVLIVAALAMTAKAYLRLRRREQARVAGTLGRGETQLRQVAVRPLATVITGALAGLVVGMTSVGAGSLLIVSLMVLYPTLRTGQLVGTDLVQAVPLVASASLGHLLFGDFALGLTGSILVGAIPGVWLGARVSSRTPGSLVRRALALVMLASGTKLLGASTEMVLVVAATALVVGLAAWGVLRVRHGEAPFTWLERRRRRAASTSATTTSPSTSTSTSTPG